MMTSLYSEQIPVTEITSDWCKFHFPRNSRVITCVNLNLALLFIPFLPTILLRPEHNCRQVEDLWIMCCMNVLQDVQFYQAR